MDEHASVPPHEQAVLYLVAAFPVPSWEQETIELYMSELEDLPGKAVTIAAREWACTQRERPSLADLRTGAKELVYKQRQKARRLREQREEQEALQDRADPEAIRQVLSDVRHRLERKALPAEVIELATRVSNRRPMMERRAEVIDLATARDTEVCRAELREQELLLRADYAVESRRSR